MRLNAVAIHVNFNNGRAVIAQFDMLIRLITRSPYPTVLKNLLDVLLIGMYRGLNFANRYC